MTDPPVSRTRKSALSASAANNIHIWELSHKREISLKSTNPRILDSHYRSTTLKTQPVF